MLDRNAQTNTGVKSSEVIRFHNVCLTIDNTQLIDNINCVIHQKGKIVVMGPNGAGKSLFLRLLAGLLKPTSGNIICAPNFCRQDAHPDISMVFQKPVLLRRSTHANVAYVLQRQNLSKTDLSSKITDALIDARLDQKALTPARRLSGGEQQRLALARALVVKPKILLLDEVTANLDPASTHIVETMLHEAAAEGTKIVFITHDVRQAKRIADEILFIHQGRVIAHNPAKQFFRDPGSNEAQAYLDGRVPNQQMKEM